VPLGQLELRAYQSEPGSTRDVLDLMRLVLACVLAGTPIWHGSSFGAQADALAHQVSKTLIAGSEQSQ
jgi:hypothetical protein